MSSPDPMLAGELWTRTVSADSPIVVPALRHELVGRARSLGASDLACDAIALAVSEALTNVVQHAYAGQEPGPLTLEARLERDDQLVVRVSDEGRGPMPRADSPGLGLGLGVMAQTADEFAISNRHDTRGTVVTLQFSLGKCDPDRGGVVAPGPG